MKYLALILILVACRPAKRATNKYYRAMELDRNKTCELSFQNCKTSDTITVTEIRTETVRDTVILAPLFDIEGYDTVRISDTTYIETNYGESWAWVVDSTLYHKSKDKDSGYINAKIITRELINHTSKIVSSFAKCDQCEVEKDEINNRLSTVKAWRNVFMVLFGFALVLLILLAFIFLK